VAANVTASNVNNEECCRRRSAPFFANKFRSGKIGGIQVEKNIF